MQSRVQTTSRRQFLVAVSAAALASACATGSGPAAGRGSAARDSIDLLLRAQAVPIRRVDSADPGVIALAARLAPARMIGLGEATHGSHEDAQLKSVLVQTLVEKHGLRTLLIEANHGGAAELDAYISARPTRLLAAEALQQSSVFRILKTEVVADLMTWLRGWNAVNVDRPVRIAGIDCQSSAADAAEALTALRSADPSAAELLAGALAPIVGPGSAALKHAALIKRLSSNERARAEAACRQIEQLLVRAERHDAAFAARRAWQGLNAFAFETADTDAAGADQSYWSRRDAYMAENALRLAGGNKAALWAHNVHVVGGRPGGDGAGFVPTGALLRDALGAGYVALTQEFSKARFRAANSAAGADSAMIEMSRTARPGTLNALLGTASPRTAWIDLARLPETPASEAWRAAPIGFDWYGAVASPEASPTDITSGPPARLIDIAVIHPELTPSRML